VIRLLLDGRSPSAVAKKLGISTSLEQYYREKAVRDHVIVRVGDSYPYRYKKGPGYRPGLYKFRKGRRSPKFVNLLARVHPGNGSSCRLLITKEGDLHTVKLLTGERTELFPRQPKGKNKDKHYTASLPIPGSITGTEGMAATLVFYPHPDPQAQGGRLEVSPPEMNLSLDRLQALQGCQPFAATMDHIIRTLATNGWRFGETIHQGTEVHYAFARSSIDPLLPGLMDCPEVHTLQRGDREDDHPLFRDLSIKEGELETACQGIALDLLAMLEVASRERQR